MLYGCTHMTTVGIKGLNARHTPLVIVKILYCYATLKLNDEERW